ncbi:uncharacterized protein LOC131033730 [Cryptomeria japonica]|uniref:uncharacterized protein LOC131033730 n=1 Tax=Cryptomeria japonica TaxID=3369 RepID=UPI0027DA40BC|nr:uncharacterized protein LOC131033730 [Cryptomeria japonica]
MVERWNKMTIPLHLLAFALSPKYYSWEVLNKSSTRVAPYRDHEVAIGYKAALRRLFLDSLRVVVRAEVMSFTSTDDCGIEALEDKANVDAHKWWYFHGEIYENLQPIAIKVLSQVASSSSSERNWSTYSFIHSIKHNKLHSKKAEDSEDLVYVHSNLRLLTHKDNTFKQGGRQSIGMLNQSMQSWMIQLPALMHLELMMMMMSYLVIIRLLPRLRLLVPLPVALFVLLICHRRMMMICLTTFDDI